MMAGLMEGGTYVVPVPGNHEVQWKAGGKKAQVVNENAWRANMGDLILDTNRCGHEHIFHMDQSRAATGGKAWQVTVGSGGSPFEASSTDTTMHPATDRDYAWATVSVFHNGKVRITVFGFDDDFGPTKVLKSVTLN